MQESASTHKSSVDFYRECIRKALKSISEIDEEIRENLEEKGIYLVQLALLGNFDKNRIKEIIEG